MKKIILFSLLLLLSAETFSQQTKSPLILTKQNNLKKSKIRKTVANIFLGTGASGVLASFLIPKGDLVEISCSTCLVYDKYYKNDIIRGTLGGVGVLLMLTSIPIYIAAHHSKKKALRLSFKNEKIPQLQKNNFALKSVPSLTLRISL